MRRLWILTLISLFLSVIVFAVKNKKPSTITAGKGLVIDKTWLHDNPNALTPVKDRRPPDQTFLTYPEWFLVFSPAEQAQYFKTNTATTFPYLKHLDQLWKGYDVVYNQVKDNYPFNGGYHLMIVVIAGSTTVEYSLKSWYETVIGRMTDTRPGTPLTAEDQFNALYMDSYVNFIIEKPWYEYNFNNQLKALWTNTPFFGDHFLRKLERRYYLTNELAVKSAYGWLIGLGTKATYNPALENTTVVVDKLSPYPDANYPRVAGNAKKLANGYYLVNLPRYAAFTHATQELVSNGFEFKEIAGNNAAILLTVITNKTMPAVDNAKTIFTQPIQTRPETNRIALVTTVNRLSAVVNELDRDKITIEHIFDY